MGSRMDGLNVVALDRIDGRLPRYQARKAHEASEATDGLN